MLYFMAVTWPEKWKKHEYWSNCKSNIRSHRAAGHKQKVSLRRHVNKTLNAASNKLLTMLSNSRYIFLSQKLFLKVLSFIHQHHPRPLGFNFNKMFFISDLDLLSKCCAPCRVDTHGERLLTHKSLWFYSCIKMPCRTREIIDLWYHFPSCRLDVPQY